MALNFKISTAARNAMANALVDLLDTGGAGDPKIAIYDGTQPAGPGTAVSTQTKLVEFTLDGTAAFGSATNGAVSLDVSPAITATASAGGTATWFRAVDSGGTAVFDGSVGTSAADLIMNTVNIALGNTCEITGFTITMPAS
jgi:hypothetical protein